VAPGRPALAGRPGGADFVHDPGLALHEDQLAMVSVVQREWAAKNPRATFKAPITVENVLNRARSPTTRSAYCSVAW